MKETVHIRSFSFSVIKQPLHAKCLPVVTQSENAIFGLSFILHMAEPIQDSIYEKKRMNLKSCVTGFCYLSVLPSHRLRLPIKSNNLSPQVVKNVL